MAHKHPTHKISDLIALLEQKQTEHGDLPVIYWDQHSSCTFDKPSNVLFVDGGALYFGGMHVAADMFCSKNTVLNNEHARGNCCFEEEEALEASADVTAAPSTTTG